VSRTWDPGVTMEFPRPTSADRLRFLLRCVPMGMVTFGGLGLLLLVRLIERPLFGVDRPMTPYITQSVCRINFLILGIRRNVRGRPMQKKGALVANHASWLDIFTLHAAARIYFVAKSEVAGWAGIGWLARATGTVFIERRVSSAKAQRELFHERLGHGHRLLFFPEGTSTDGLRVLTFKSTLFDAFFDDAHREGVWLQPVTLNFVAPAGADPRFYGWWGGMEFGPPFAMVLSAGRQGRVETVFHDPVRVSDFPDRKALARHLEGIVRGGFAAAD